jgi:hypothetical protein
MQRPHPMGFDGINVALDGELEAKDQEAMKEANV